MELPVWVCSPAGGSSRHLRLQLLRCSDGGRFAATTATDIGRFSAVVHEAKRFLPIIMILSVPFRESLFWRTSGGTSKSSSVWTPPEAPGSLALPEQSKHFRNWLDPIFFSLRFISVLACLAYAGKSPSRPVLTLVKYSYRGGSERSPLTMN